MEKTIGVIALMVVIVIVGCLVVPWNRAFINRWDYTLKKVDETTRYETVKKVEDTSRAMIASYTADKMMYEQYAGSESAEKQSWAEQAKMRANKTAAEYNAYILKNSFVWADNIPADIRDKLEYLE